MESHTGKRKNSKCCPAVLLLMLALFLAGGSLVRAEGNRTVRVGCVDIDNFLTVDEQGNAVGYGAEYLDKISAYSGWEYEYVEGSWKECLQWLKEGKIDLLLPAEHTEEREKDYLFSDDRCCMDYAALIALKENDDYYYEDFFSFQGMTVGVIEGNYLNQVFDRYAEENHFSVSVKMYPNSEMLENALASGEVEAIVNGNMNFYSTQKLLAKIDYMPAYFITSTERPDLMAGLNEAQRQIYLENPYYVAELHQKYYGAIERQAVGFTREEADYVKRAGELTVLCAADHYPLSWYDDESGSIKGFYADILKFLSEKSGLEFRLAGYQSEKAAVGMIREGKADILIGIPAERAAGAKSGLLYTTPFYELPYMVMTYQGTDARDDEDSRIALPDCEEYMKTWIGGRYPECTVVSCETWEDCTAALKKGNADILPVNVLSWQTVSGFQNEPKLVNMATAYFQVPVCLMISAGQPGTLEAVLNKAILKIDEKEVRGCVLNNTLLMKRQVTLKQLMRQNPIQMTLLGIITAVLLVSLAMLLYISRLKTKQNQKLAEKNAQLEEARRLETELTDKIRRDKLTGVLDKITSESSCEQYLADGGAGVLLILDIDNFKVINDTHGHQSGDGILKEVGKILQALSRPGDIAGRIGGDEFLLFLKGMRGYDVARARLEELRTAMEGIDLIRGQRVSCSVGAALAPEDGQDFKTLFRAADKAMYGAKETGKNSWQFFR